MEHRLPSDEELIDLSWLLDSALMVGDRGRAIEAGSRLHESLLRHHQGITECAPEAIPTTAACRHTCLTLSADVASVLTKLSRGDTLSRVEFRHRVQALVAGPTKTPACH